MTETQTDITERELEAISMVNFDHLVGEGNDEFHNEPVPEKPGKKKKKTKEVEVSTENQTVEGEIVAEIPEITSPEWHDYVIRQLEEDEKDENGNPYVHGLRRITELLIGPILESRAHVVQAPDFVESVGKLLRPATVEYTIVVLCTHGLRNGIEPYRVEYTDVADVYDGNTDPTYARYPTSMAATRAEGRAYRKLLRLKQVVASEELTTVPLEEAGLNGQITPSQINYIDLMCRRLKIDVMKYINCGAKKYASIEDVTYVTAQKMTELLCTYQNDSTKIPEEIRGYKLDWANQ